MIQSHLPSGQAIADWLGEIWIGFHAVIAAGGIVLLLLFVGAAVHDLFTHEKPVGDETVWPGTTPPDKTDPHWDKRNMTVKWRGEPYGVYHKAEVAPGKWEWVLDRAETDKLRKVVIEHESEFQSAQFHKNQVFAALASRVLTGLSLIHI